MFKWALQTFTDLLKTSTFFTGKIEIILRKIFFFLNKEFL